MLTIKNRTDFFVIMKAIELASKGFNIATTDFTELKTTWWNAKTKSFQSKMTDNVPEVYFELTDEVVEVFPFIYNKYVKRNKDKLWETLPEIPEGCEKIIVSLDMVKNTMTFLARNEVYCFSDVDRALYDAEYITELQALDNSYNPKEIPESFVNNMSRDAVRKYFSAISAFAYKDNARSVELLTALSDAYDKDFDFSVLGDSFKDYKVVDNRMYIPIKESWKRLLEDKRVSKDCLENSCFVLSKNPYDYYWCSYGSEFQSCFALNSEHGGWIGAVVNSLTPSCFMLYLTKKDSQKVSLTGEGIKYPAPYMYARAWCWLTEDGKLNIDKIYASNREYYERVFESSVNLLDFCFKNKDRKRLYKPEETANIISKYRCYFYPDSIRNYGSDEMKFEYDNGDKGFYGNYRKNNLKSKLEELRSVSDSLSLNKPIRFTSGKLFNPKVCPVTGLEIDESQDVSEYACKFKDKVDGGLAVITYIDGFVKVDAISCKPVADSSCNYNLHISGLDDSGRRSPRQCWLNDTFYTIPENLDKFKAHLKEDLNVAGTNMKFILLRVINGGQVTWVKLRKDK